MTDENKKGRPKQKQDNTFQQRFMSLVGEKASHAEIADKIGTSRQNVGNWLTRASTKPDIYTLAKIAKAYNVSTDYLLGLNDEKTADINIQAMHRYTGLDEKSIELLHIASQVEKIICYTLDTIIQTDFLTELSRNISLLALYSQLPKNEAEKMRNEISEAFETGGNFDVDDLCSLYRYRAMEDLIKLLDSFDGRKE